MAAGNKKGTAKGKRRRTTGTVREVDGDTANGGLTDGANGRTAKSSASKSTTDRTTTNQSPPSSPDLLAEWTGMELSSPPRAGRIVPPPRRFSTTSSRRRHDTTSEQPTTSLAVADGRDYPAVTNGEIELTESINDFAQLDGNSDDLTQDPIEIQADIPDPANIEDQADIEDHGDIERHAEALADERNLDILPLRTPQAPNTTTVKVPLRSSPPQSRPSKKGRGRPRKSSLALSQRVPTPGPAAHRRRSTISRQNGLPIDNAHSLTAQGGQRILDEEQPVQKTLVGLDGATDERHFDMPHRKPSKSPAPGEDVVLEAHSRHSPRATHEATVDEDLDAFVDQFGAGDGTVSPRRLSLDDTIDPLPQARRSSSISMSSLRSAMRPPRGHASSSSPKSVAFSIDRPVAAPKSHVRQLQARAVPEFDSIVESEEFSMVSLSTVPSARQHAPALATMLSSASQPVLGGAEGHQSGQTLLPSSINFADTLIRQQDPQGAETMPEDSTSVDPAQLARQSTGHNLLDSSGKPLTASASPSSADLRDEAIQPGSKYRASQSLIMGHRPTIVPHGPHILLTSPQSEQSPCKIVPAQSATSRTPNPTPESVADHDPFLAVADTDLSAAPALCPMPHDLDWASNVHLNPARSPRHVAYPDLTVYQLPSPEESTLETIPPEINMEPFKEDGSLALDDHESEHQTSPTAAASGSGTNSRASVSSILEQGPEQSDAELGETEEPHHQSIEADHSAGSDTDREDYQPVSFAADTASDVSFTSDEAPQVVEQSSTDQQLPLEPSTKFAANECSDIWQNEAKTSSFNHVHLDESDSAELGAQYEANGHEEASSGEQPKELDIADDEVTSIGQGELPTHDGQLDSEGTIQNSDSFTNVENESDCDGDTTTPQFEKSAQAGKKRRSQSLPKSHKRRRLDSESEPWNSEYSVNFHEQDTPMSNSATTPMPSILAHITQSIERGIRQKFFGQSHGNRCTPLPLKSASQHASRPRQAVQTGENGERVSAKVPHDLKTPTSHEASDLIPSTSIIERIVSTIPGWYATPFARRTSMESANVKHVKLADGERSGFEASDSSLASTESDVETFEGLASPNQGPKQPFSKYLPFATIHYERLREVYLKAQRHPHWHRLHSNSPAATFANHEFSSLGWHKFLEPWQLAVVDEFLHLLARDGVELSHPRMLRRERSKKAAASLKPIDAYEVARRVFSLWVGQVQRGEVALKDEVAGMWDRQHVGRRASVLAQQQAWLAAQGISRDKS